MSDTAIPSYDWDKHFQLADDLRHLDLYYLQFSGRRTLQQADLKNHLINEFVLAVQNREQVPIRESYEMLSAGVDRMVVLAERHAGQSAGRAWAIARHAAELVRLFPEDHLRPFVDQELALRRSQLQDLYENVLVTQPIYLDGGMAFHNMDRWSRIRLQIEAEMRRYEGILEQAAEKDRGPADDTLLRKRSLIFAQRQEELAAASLDHAETQTSLIEECLRMATTIMALPNVYQVQLFDRMKTLADVASGLMVVADFTLTEAADLRNSANLSRNLQRPIFKVSYP